MAEYIERYTRWNDEWGRYTVPLLTREDGSRITLGIFTEREERLNQPHDNIIIAPQTEHIFGEFIDRLAELENKIEFGGLVEARREHWIVVRDNNNYPVGLKCSGCGRKVRKHGEKYCPECGAKMDGKGDDND